MTTATTGSAFPPSIDELVPRVQARAIELGAPLSRNRVMREFGVGAAKAKAVLDAVAGSEVNPATRPEVTPGRVLHAVSTPVATPETTDPDPAPSVTAGSETTVLVAPVADPGTEIVSDVVTQAPRAVDESPAGTAAAAVAGGVRSGGRVRSGGGPWSCWPCPRS
jgi:hypothetical protein